MNFFARFRRQPTLVIQAISAVLTYLVTYQISGLSAVQAGAIVAVLSAALGVYNAWKVRPISPAVWQTVVTTGAALLSAYGMNWSQEQIGSLQMAVIAVMAMLTWQSVTPKDDPAPVGVAPVDPVTVGPELPGSVPPGPTMAQPRQRDSY